MVSSELLRRVASVLTRATRRNNPEDDILHSHSRENLKSYILRGLRSRYSDSLLAGQPRGLSSSLDKVKNSHVSISFRQALLPTQPPSQWVSKAFFPRGKAALS
jgi:hypothetical protein